MQHLGYQALVRFPPYCLNYRFEPSGLSEPPQHISNWTKPLGLATRRRAQPALTHNIMPTIAKATNRAIIAIRPDIFGSGSGSCMAYV